MKYINKVLVVVLITFLGGCSVGGNFNKMNENQLVVGKTTKTDIVSSMGKPFMDATSIHNGIEIDNLTYLYINSGEKAAFPGMTPVRVQIVYFKEEVLIGKQYDSTFAVDSTLFDLEKAKKIKKGQTKADVISMLGEPKGENHFPLIDNEEGYAYIYMFTHRNGSESNPDVLFIEFDSKNIVTKTKLTVTSQHKVK